MKKPLQKLPQELMRGIDIMQQKCPYAYATRIKTIKHPFSTQSARTTLAYGYFI